MMVSASQVSFQLSQSTCERTGHSHLRARDPEASAGSLPIAGKAGIQTPPPPSMGPFSWRVGVGVQPSPGPSRQHAGSCLCLWHTMGLIFWSPHPHPGTKDTEVEREALASPSVLGGEKRREEGSQARASAKLAGVRIPEWVLPVLVPWAQVDQPPARSTPLGPNFYP